MARFFVARNAAINLKKVAESSAGGCQPFQRQADCSV